MDPITLSIVLAAFVVGILLGATTLQLAGKSQKKSRNLEKAVQNKEEEIKEYRSEVNEHFAQTSELLNQLAHNYREIHNHLASGAENLCEKTPYQPMIKPLPELLNQEAQLEDKSDETDTASTQPPLDYAPKNPDSKGALSEDFGLEKVNINDSTDSEKA